LNASAGVTHRSRAVPSPSCGRQEFVGGHDPRAQRAERVDSLAEAEHARFHFAALNVACRNVIENYISADVAGRFFRRKVFARFLRTTASSSS